MNKAKNEFPLKQKEIITLGLLAQQSYSATELSKILNQGENQSLRNWLGNLLEYDLIIKFGDGKGTQYEINPKFLHLTNLREQSILKKIQNHKLEELIYKDITSYPDSSFGDIHKRIGQDVNKNTVRWILKQMVDDKKLEVIGANRWMKYSIARNLRENDHLLYSITLYVFSLPILHFIDMPQHSIKISAHCFSLIRRKGLYA
jgi:ATP-dependent DNA helicase RecG